MTRLCYPPATSHTVTARTQLGESSAHTAHMHALHKSEERAVHDKRGPTIGNKGHWQSGHRRDAERHADVLEHLPQQHGEHPSRDVRTEQIFRQAGDSPDAHQRHTEQGE